ncbi:hypothetical protein FIM12_03315 [SAR202 cluster bacterium AD-804-J14_MRT_500m]|nr:hypothetical protein [SAR202 cluster bacterium AD-804-J14_MRT_500m]
MIKSDDASQNVVTSLKQLGIVHEILACDPKFADTLQFCEKYGYLLKNSGNTIIVGTRRDPKQYAACVVQASRKLDVNRTVRRLMGVRRLSFASAEETKALTGMAIGGVTPFNLPRDISLYVDEELMQEPYVILGSGSRSSKIKVSPGVLRNISGAIVVPNLSKII